MKKIIIDSEILLTKYFRAKAKHGTLTKEDLDIMKRRYSMLYTELDLIAWANQLNQANCQLILFSTSPTGTARWLKCSLAFGKIIPNFAFK